jgi:exopolysaccharide production protein ExoZ
MIRMASARIDTVQGLRAIAALLVVVDHSMAIMIAKGALPGVGSDFAWIFGGIGVKIFFLISGFIMTVTTHDEFAAPGASRRFLWKRFLRIAPLYWIATMLYAAKLSLQGSPPHLLPLLFSFLFIPYRNDLGALQPVYGLGWTLNYEMFFYVLFGFALTFKILTGMAGLIGFLIGLVLIVKLEAFAFAPGFAASILGFLGDPIVLFFCGGILIGALRIGLANSGRLLPIGIYVALTGALACVLAYVVYVFAAFSADPSSNWEIAACASAVIFCGLAADPIRHERLRPLLRALGDASYSIYLTHGFFIGAGQRIWSTVFGQHGAAYFILTMIIFCGAVGLLSYRYVEKPLLKILRGRISGKPQTARG